MRLTKRQRNLLGFLAKSLDENGAVPTTAQMREHFGYRSRTTVHKHLNALEQAGLLRKQRNAVDLLHDRWSMFLYKLPFRGVVR